MDLKQYINGYKITYEWLIKSLKDKDEIFTKTCGNRVIKNITASDVSEGKGFASEILRCVITFEDSKDVYVTILKVPTLKANKVAPGDEPNPSDPILAAGHQRECDFYTKLASILDIALPKIYTAIGSASESQASCIHMEDLTLRGETLSFFDSVNLTQVKNYIRTQAKMHKNIWMADEGLWRGKYLVNEGAIRYVTGFLEPMIKPFLAMSKREKDFEPLINKYQKFATNPEFPVYVASESHLDLNLAPVIVHRDAHSGNVMWSKDSRGDIQNDITAILDWQLFQEGSPMDDLARFLTLAADGVVRRQVEAFAVDFYLQCLTEEFDGDASKVPYTAEGLQKAYNLSFLTQAFNLLGMVVFLSTSLEKQAANKGIKDAYLEAAVLKVLHGLEDMDRLLQGEMKDVFEKYGL